MALYNEILVGRFNKLVSKVFGMKGQAPAPQVSSEITFSHPIFHGRENRFLESWESFMILALQAAGGAGNTSHVRFTNPSGSNMVAVIEKLSVSLGAPGGFIGRFATTPGVTQPALVNPYTPSNMDVRGRPASVMQITSEAVAAPAQIGNRFGSFTVGANPNAELIFTDIQEIVLGPATALDLLDNALNDSMNVTIWWRERFLEESERF